MPLVVLGLSGALTHDPSAAIYIDGQLIAAAEEERFTRQKHAKHAMPLHASRYCLKEAGLKPKDVDVVAFPFAKTSIFGKARWHYARRYWYAPERAIDALFNGNRHYRRNVKKVRELVSQLGINWPDIQFDAVEHHIAHASSAYHLSGFEGKVAILGIDGKGEYATTFFGYGEEGRIHKIKEFYDPDSLGQLYASFTEYLGFEMLDGEFKVMGMAPYAKENYYKTIYTKVFKDIQKFKDLALIHNKRPKNLYGYLKENLRHERFDNIAGAVQYYVEITVRELLKRIYKKYKIKNFFFSGGISMNVKMHNFLIKDKNVTKIHNAPSGSDESLSIGACYYLNRKNQSFPLKNLSLGIPVAEKNSEIKKIIAKNFKRNFKINYSIKPKYIAKLISKNEIIAIADGREEFGARALGNRSIIANPSNPDNVKQINEFIKNRDFWMPFAPSVLDNCSKEYLIKSEKAIARHMAITFQTTQKGYSKMIAGCHDADKTARAQIVTRKMNKDYHELISAFKKITDCGALLNTSFNLHGFPVVRNLKEAYEVLNKSDLDGLISKNYIFLKKKVRIIN